jgi:DNA-binding transcriptional regulator YiaG
MLWKFDFHATAPYYETNRRKNLLTRLTQEQFLAVLEATNNTVYFWQQGRICLFSLALRQLNNTE